jgi:hypothetical protein
MYPIGTKLHLAKDSVDLDLELYQVELITEPGSCGRDEFLFHWNTTDGLTYLTTSDELDGLLADKATLTPPK